MVIHKFDSCMPEYQARAQHGRNEDTVGDLTGNTGRGTQSWRNDVLAGKIVDNTADNHVQRYGNCI